VAVKQPSLENLFIKLTGRELREMRAALVIAAHHLRRTVRSPGLILLLLAIRSRSP
jgi:hypothetical protein